MENLKSSFNNNFYPVLNYINEAIIVVKDNSEICMVNSYAEENFKVQADHKIDDYSITRRLAFFKDGYEYKIGGRNYKIKIKEYDFYTMYVFIDYTWKAKLSEDIRNMKKESKDFHNLIDTFGDSSLYITDEKGITTWVGSTIAKDCGTTKERLIGKSVFELEEEKLFYPSSCAASIRSRQRELVIQTTAIGKKFISIAVPLFDKDNNLIKVISLSKKYKIGTVKTLEEVIAESYYKKDKYYPNIISKSMSMIEVKNLIDLCSIVDSPVLIYGERGSGKKYIARAIHNMSSRVGKSFINLNFKKLSEEEQKEIWLRGGAIERALGGTIYITNILEASSKCLDNLLKCIKERSNVNNVRFIIGCSRKSNKILNAKVDEIIYYCNFLKIYCPSLRERKDDIFIISKYFLEELNKRYQKEKVLSSLALKNLYNYEWPGNTKELEDVITELFFNTEGDVISQEDLPENIRECLEDNNLTNRLKKIPIQPLKENVSDFEKQIIITALLKCKNATVAAKELGLTQSTMSRKIQKYNIADYLEGRRDNE